MNISEWLAAGQPTRRTGTWPNYVNRFGCNCDSALELSYEKSFRDAWFSQCTLCRSNTERVQDLPYVPDVGFIGKGVEVPAGANVIVPSMPAPEGTSMQTSGPLGFASAVPFETTPSPSAFTLPTNGASAPASGLNGGTVMASLTPSVCKGPYDRKGTMCVPKPDCKARQPNDPCVPYSLVGAAVGGLTDLLNGGSAGPGATGLTDPGYGGGATSPCPTGYTWDGTQCIATGVTGTLQRLLPGGATGTGVDVYGQAVVGAWGKPALVPYTEQRVVRRCPPGSVLGKDGLCYDKLANQNRMWPRGPRPKFTGADMKALRKAESLKKTAKEVAGYWYSCKLK